ncbi:RNase III inhibitor, partial [Candidatus Nomurabacteria bacterium]|nr:RNase III inhibitor [Candidatus Nomurabacteria bacterium]
MPFTIVRQDITKMKVDAIVNAANLDLQMGGGVCGAIFEAEITPGFDLPAKHIIHTAGPVYDHSNVQQSENLLRNAYVNSLKLAVTHKCESVAFPLISSGIYGYPKDEALRVATSAIQEFIFDHEMEVFLVVFDKEAFTISEKLLGEVASYIDEHYVETHRDARREQINVYRKPSDEIVTVQYKKEMPQKPSFLLESPNTGIDDYVNKLDEP